MIVSFNNSSVVYSYHSIPIFPTLHYVLNRSNGNCGPVLVHCGTGVSRSGVFIAVDSLLEQAREEHVVNVFRLECSLVD